MCLIFDGDFASYLIEHCRPDIDEENTLQKVGFIEEDFEKVLKTAVIISLEH